MDYSFSSEQRAAYQAFGDLLAGKLPFERLLQPSDPGDHKAEASMLRTMAADGWLELLCPEDGDWQPTDLVGAVHIMEHLGRIPSSNLTLHLMGFVLPLVHTLAPGQTAEIISLLEAGKLVSAVVPDRTVDGRYWYSAGIDEDSAELISLAPNPRTPVVIAADRVDVVIVPVRSSDRTWSLGLVELGDPAQRADLHLLDLSAPFGPIGPRTASWLQRTLPGGTRGGIPEAEFREGIDRAVQYYLLGLGSQAVGGGAELVRRTVQYVSERKQFGRPIASFQALRHIVADMHLLVENSRAMLYETAWRGAGRSSASREYVAAARAYTAGSYVKVAESAIQCFGGIGFTWEGGIHAWYRNALANAYYLSDVRLANQVLEHLLGSESSVGSGIAS
jgi:alkylation response protein AidB-like acyl-CoA dehydrogenase